MQICTQVLFDQLTLVVIHSNLSNEACLFVRNVLFLRLKVKRC